MSDSAYPRSSYEDSLPVREQVSSGGVVYRRGEDGVEVALIAVGRARRWQLPKGTLDPGETLEITALREVREETGLTAEIVAPLQTIEYWYVGHSRRGAVRFHKRVSFYLLSYRSGEVSDHDREVVEARWVPIKDALRMLTFKNEQHVLQLADEMISTEGLA